MVRRRLRMAVVGMRATRLLLCALAMCPSLLFCLLLWQARAIARLRTLCMSPITCAWSLLLRRWLPLLLHVLPSLWMDVWRSLGG